MEINKKVIIKKLFLPLLLFIVVVLLWSYNQTIFAQEATVPTGAFLGEYYDNQDFTSLVLSRRDNEINFDWGRSSPDPTIEADSFSVRWRGNFFFEEEVYKFTSVADDGVRVYLDGEILIDNWSVQRARERTVIREVTSGAHQVKVEYFEQGGVSVISVDWEITEPPQVEPTLVPTATPTFTPTPTPTPSATADSESGTDQEGTDGTGKGGFGVLQTDESGELPETGMFNAWLIILSSFFAIFGIYLFKQFRLAK